MVVGGHCCCDYVLHSVCTMDSDDDNDARAKLYGTHVGPTPPAYAHANTSSPDPSPCLSTPNPISVPIRIPAPAKRLWRRTMAECKWHTDVGIDEHGAKIYFQPLPVARWPRDLGNQAGGGAGGDWRLKAEAGYGAARSQPPTCPAICGSADGRPPAN